MMIMNPWRRIRQLEEENRVLNDMLLDEINVTWKATLGLHEIAQMANEKSSGTAKRMAKHAKKTMMEIANDH